MKFGHSCQRLPAARKAYIWRIFPQQKTSRDQSEIPANGEAVWKDFDTLMKVRDVGA